jgi:hypothetical protein
MPVSDLAWLADFSLALAETGLYYLAAGVMFALACICFGGLLVLAQGEYRPNRIVTRRYR